VCLGAVFRRGPSRAFFFFFFLRGGKGRNYITVFIQQDAKGAAQSVQQKVAIQIRNGGSRMGM